MKGRDLDECQTCGERRDESHHGGRYRDPERQHAISSAPPAVRKRACVVPEGYSSGSTPRYAIFAEDFHGPNPGFGFDAQTFARDLIAGMFYLLDDAFRVDEYIQAGRYKGT